jgi:nanoRNase/pAp phosphatase (c-di-AMP/oligoRNAs hydrolase)
VVSGVVGNDLHISVRNVGYVRGAGDVARAAFGDLGSAGGHRTMAKAVLPADSLVRGGADGDPEACQDRIVQRFLRAIGANGRSGER